MDLGGLGLESVISENLGFHINSRFLTFHLNVTFLRKFRRIRDLGSVSCEILETPHFQEVSL